MPRIFAVQLKDEPAERYEQWVNTPVYTHDYEDCVGWLGCELPEDGHSCEFAELAGDGAVTCASSSKVNQLRSENAKLRELLEAILQCAGETKRDKGCDACPMFNGDEAGAFLNKNWCLLRPTMRELGIEVPYD